VSNSDPIKYDDVEDIVSDLIPGSTNNSVKQKPKSGPNKKKVIKFKDDELDLFDKVSKDMGIDNKTHSDLTSLPPEIPDPSQEEIIDLLKDKKLKTTVLEQGKTPPIENVLDEGDEIGEITDEEIQELRRKDEEARKNMIALLAPKDSINLDIKYGMKDGKSVFVSKKYYFNSISKRDEMHLGMMRARLNQINTEYQVVARKSWDEMTDEQVDFMSLAPAMIEIGSYKLSEFEAKLRLGMPPEDFARVDVIQYGLALQVIASRTLKTRFSRQGR